MLKYISKPPNHLSPQIRTTQHGDKMNAPCRFFMWEKDYREFLLSLGHLQSDRHQKDEETRSTNYVVASRQDCMEILEVLKQLRLMVAIGLALCVVAIASRFA
ncbi:hypothetical protein ABZP36_016411 [Zizania latifolia]